MATRAMSRIARLVRKSELERIAIEERERRNLAKLALLVSESDDDTASQNASQLAG